MHKISHQKVNISLNNNIQKFISVLFYHPLCQSNLKIERIPSYLRHVNFKMLFEMGLAQTIQLPMVTLVHSVL